MTLVVALALVMAACFLWPPFRRRADPVGDRPLDRTTGDGCGLDAAVSGAALSDVVLSDVAAPDAAASLATVGAEGSGPVTVDDAADALVLCALALRSGLGPIEALEAVAQHAGGPVAHHLRVVASAHRWGQDAATSWAHVGEAWRPAALAWQAAEQSGAAPAGVVLAAAERMRREEASRVEAAVQRAGVLLVLPLGACFLPGFVGTTVVPVVLHLARSSLGVG